MTAASTSRVFTAALKAKERMDAQVWPPLDAYGHDGYNRSPQIAFADESPSEHAEIVAVLADVGDDSSISWRTMPGGRDEVFDLVFSIWTATGSTDQTAVVERLQQLADVVQRAFYDEETSTMLPLDIAQHMKLEGVGQVSFIVTQVDRIEGYVGRAFVTYRLNFRI